MMNRYGISKYSYERILHLLKQYPEIKEVTIFGSRAIGKDKNGSDIDLAISGESVSSNLIYKLKIIFNERLPIPYKVDIVHYDTLAHEGLKDHIRRKGKTFYSGKAKNSEEIQHSIQ